MTVAILIEDLAAGEILATLLARVDVDAKVFRRPRSGVDLDRHLTALRHDFSDIVAVGAPLAGARHLGIEPSLEAWLTRDGAANREVLGTDEVPAPERARGWLRELAIASNAGARRYSAVLDGRALANRLDLGLLAAFSLEFRTWIGALRPGWTTSRPLRRGRGRPPGVQLFRGSGYALCLELLHRGERAEVTVAELADAVQRTKTPVLRLIAEAERRGFLRRTSPRGPVQVRNTDRLLDDLVVSISAERARRPPPVLGLSSDRDPARLPARIAVLLRQRGAILALTGAAAVAEVGGDLLVGGPVRAYANLPLDSAAMADGYPEPRHPQLVLIDPADEEVLHRTREGSPARVSPWQAVIDLLASDSEREREIGTVVRRHLSESPR